MFISKLNKMGSHRLQKETNYLKLSAVFFVAELLLLHKYILPHKMYLLFLQYILKL